MSKFDDIKKLKELLDNDLITQKEFDNQKKLILDIPVATEETPKAKVQKTKEYNRIQEEKHHNKITVIVVCSLFAIFFASILVGIRHDRIILDKKEFASEITSDTDYKVRYRPKKHIFEYVAKDGTDWQDILESNTEEYRDDDSVRATFIHNWRNNVIPSIKVRSREKLVKGSTIEIIDSIDESTKLLEIEDGEVIYDKFENIED